MKMPEGEHRWLPERELREIAEEAGFRPEAALGRILCPKKVPFASALLNRAAERFPFLKPVCLTQVLVYVPR
jgi:hypothetical protein